MAKKSDSNKKPGRRPGKETNLVPKGYEKFLGELKERIRSAQLRAAVSVNRELVLLYWQIGRDILSRQKAHGWGKVIVETCWDLRRVPRYGGFSPRNLKYMRAFYWPHRSENATTRARIGRAIATRLAQIPWCHKPMLIGQGQGPESNVSGMPERPSRTAGAGTFWSIGSRAISIERQGKAQTNFERSLPCPAIRPCEGASERPLRLPVPHDCERSRRARDSREGWSPISGSSCRARGRVRVPRPAVQAGSGRRRFLHRPALLSRQTSLLRRAGTQS